MTNIYIIIYLCIGLIIGSLYFQYWFEQLMPQEVKLTSKLKQSLIYGAVLSLGLFLWPFASIDLIIYYTKKRKEEK